MDTDRPAPATVEAAPNLDLVICGIREIDATLDARVTHVISILDPGFDESARFAALPPENFLRLTFSDIIDEAPGMELPAEGHVAAILAFGGAALSLAGHRVLIHCHMGISRSTAAAIMLLAQHGRDPAAAVARVAEMRPIAWPNLRMIELADGLLELDRRLVDAVRRHHAKTIRGKNEFRDSLIRHGRGREIDGLISTD